MLKGKNKAFPPLTIPDFVAFESCKNRNLERGYYIPEKTIVIARSALRDEAIHIIKNTGLLHPRKPWFRNDDVAHIIDFVYI